MKDKKESFQNSKEIKKNKREKPRIAIPSSELFGKKPITRVEETKVSQKLLKVVNIV